MSGEAARVPGDLFGGALGDNFLAVHDAFEASMDQPATKM